jgi:hypothetical protein
VQTVDRVVTLMNILLTKESLNYELNIAKVRDELLIEDHLESFLCRIFEPLIQSESPFLHDVSKHEMFTLIQRVFETDKIPEKP